MIDDVFDFDNILDASDKVPTFAKFRPKQRAKPQKASLPSRSAVPDATADIKDQNVGASTQGKFSEGLSSQGRASLVSLDGETVDDLAGSQGILNALNGDVQTVSRGPVNNSDAACHPAIGVDSSVDNLPIDDEHGNASSRSARSEERSVISDIRVSPASSCGKTIDDIVEFGEISDTKTGQENVVKLQPNVQVKLLKASKSQKTNQTVEDSTIDDIIQTKSGDNDQTGLHKDQVQARRCHEIVQASDSKKLFGTDNSDDSGNLANLDSVLEEPVQEETIVKFQPKLRVKPGNSSSSKVTGTDDNVTASTPMIEVCTDNNDMWTKPKDKETITNPATCLPQDVHATVDIDYHNELSKTRTDGTEVMIGEVSAEPTFKSRSNVRRGKGRGKSVSFAQLDASEGVAPEMGNFSHSSNDKLTDENINNSPEQTAEKHCNTEEQYSNDQEYTYNVWQYSEGEPSDPAVEQQAKLNVQIGSSMNLRSREKLPKAGKPQRTAEDYFEDAVEPSIAEQDNDSGDEYTIGANLKVRGKSRNSIEKPQKQKVQKDKSQVSSRGRKRTSKDASTEKTEKKLTHRIRQKRMTEVKTLLETPFHEISVEQLQKLSAAHLRLLQEARERITADHPSGPRPSTSSQLEDMDIDGETTNYDGTDRTEDNVQNATKLNYHSYMNKQTRAKWSKSDTDLFYQALRQFGSDFAMIQQLFPDRTRHQVRQKFKAEERKSPMQVNDAIIHRSRDNLYFKKVIKQLNIEDVQPESTETHKQDGASNEGGPGNKNAMDDFIKEDEENGSEWMDKEHSMQMSDVQDEDPVSGDADDLSAVFDWY